MSEARAPVAGVVPARQAEPVAVGRAVAEWRGPRPATTPEQVAQLQREGFVVLGGALRADEIAELDREARRLVEEHASLPRVRQGFELELVQDAERGLPTFRRIGGVAQLSGAFARLAAHPRLLDLLHALLGARIELWRDILMLKAARVGREKPWHQDAVYWPWRPMALVSILTAIDACTPQNGCIQVVPRSHRAALKHRGRERRVELKWRHRLRTRYVPLAAGDALVFHSLLLHASEANRSERDRRVCINTYKSPELEFVGPPERRRDCPLVSVRRS